MLMWNGSVKTTILLSKICCAACMQFKQQSKIWITVLFNMMTRKKTELFAIGQPLEMLPASVLPTAEDILVGCKKKQVQEV